MTKKQKIIVSITGIFLVLMILVGLTYAYFLTKITGNTNEKSISVTTANLVLKYGEETQDIITKEALMPGETAAVKVFSATNEGNSTVTYGASLENITYTNLENNTSIDSLDRQEDLVYTLECKQYLKTGFTLSPNGTVTGTEDGTCNGKTETIFPTKTNFSLMTTNTIDVNHTQVYTLTIVYKNVEEDQSDDMNKKFEGKVNIVDLRANADKINPYSANKSALNYQIINNALNGGTNKTTYGSEVTTFTSVSGENERVLNTAPDDYGTSYYFRGNVLDNYVTFADKTWRIVRINGDGSIRLVLDDIAKDSSGATITTAFNSSYEDNAYIGYMYGKTGQTDTNLNQCIKLNDAGTIAEVDTTKKTQDDCEVAGYKWATTPYDATHVNVVNSTIKVSLENWYKTNILDTNNSSYLADTLFCNDKTIAPGTIGMNNSLKGYNNNLTFYSVSGRLIFSSGTTSITTSQPTLECAKGADNTYSRFTSSSTVTSKGIKVNSDLTYPVGLLTADEASYAGAYKVNQTNKTYYLYNSSVTANTWFLSPRSFDALRAQNTYYYTSNNALMVSYVGNSTNFSYRPSINLKADVLLSGGNGTKENPYTVKLS